MIFTAIVTCPHCGHKQQEEMLEHITIGITRCTGCKTQLHTPTGYCCIYCSYADLPCPQEQVSSGCCG